METENLRYESKVETTSAIGRRFDISIAPESVQTYLNTRFQALQKTATIKGFRKGKVPINLVKQYYSAEVKTDVLKKLVSESFWRAAQEHKVTPVGTPEINELKGDNLDQGQPLTFQAKVEILPEIKMADLKSVRIQKFTDEVTDKDVEASLQNMRESHAEVKSYEGLEAEDSTRKAADGDYVEISFEGTLADGKTHDSLKGSHHLVKIGGRRFMAEFETGLVGMKKGEQKSVTVNFPTDFPDELVAGAAVSFLLTLHEIKHTLLPELDDVFAKRYKLETLVELRERVKKQLLEDRKREAKDKTKESMIKALIEKHEFEVPRALIDAEARTIVEDTVSHMQKQNFTEKMVRTEILSLMNEIRASAEQRVRAFLLFDRIAEVNKLEVEDADLENEYSEMAKSINSTVEQVKQFYAAHEDAVRRIQHRIKEDRVMGFLLQQVKSE